MRSFYDWPQWHLLVSVSAPPRASRCTSRPPFNYLSDRRSTASWRNCSARSYITTGPKRAICHNGMSPLTSSDAMMSASPRASRSKIEAFIQLSAGSNVSCVVVKLSRIETTTGDLPFWDVSTGIGWCHHDCFVLGFCLHPLNSSYRHSAAPDGTTLRIIRRIVVRPEQATCRNRMSVCIGEDGEDRDERRLVTQDRGVGENHAWSKNREQLTRKGSGEKKSIKETNERKIFISWSGKLSTNLTCPK